jgi:hypothetical protein
MPMSVPVSAAWDWERGGGEVGWGIDGYKGEDGEREDAGMECFRIAVFIEMDPREAMDSSS